MPTTGTPLGQTYNVSILKPAALNVSAMMPAGEGGGGGGEGGGEGGGGAGRGGGGEGGEGGGGGRGGGGGWGGGFSIHTIAILIEGRELFFRDAMPGPQVRRRIDHQQDEQTRHRG